MNAIATPRSEIIVKTEMSAEVKLIGSLLGSRFTGFKSPFNVQGLADTGPNRVDFLAIYTEHRGDGRFTAMLAALKEVTDNIGVYAVTNARFGRYL